jgi:membrane-bound lytic murein transglycosylase D
VRVNTLKDQNRIYVGMKLVIPAGGVSASLASTPAPAKSPNKKAVAKAPPPTEVVVKSGDTLSVIATRNGVTVAQIREWNGLENSVIHPGQKLGLRGASAPHMEKVSYTVVKGDTLSGIAARYGVGVEEVVKWNGLRGASHIQVGQQLEVRLSNAAWKTYTVRSGDNLTLIARRHRCTVSELQDWNTLSGNVIHPGQVLRFR